MLASPLVLAQKRRPRIAILAVANPGPFIGPLKEALRASGHVDGKTVDIVLRSAEGNTAALPGLAAELVKANPDVLVAWQTPSAHAAKEATSSIPIVILAGDPVGTGLVKSLARPDGNITGVSATTAVVGGKTLELIREAMPGTSRIGVLANVSDPFTPVFLQEIQQPAQRMSVSLWVVRVRGPQDYDEAFGEFSKQKVQALIVQPSLPRDAVVKLALHHRLPAISPTRTFPEAGGLMSYAPTLAEMYRGVAEYVDKILRGAKPTDLPMQQPTKFELVINMKTAKTLGLTVPRNVLLRADHVIE